MKQFFVHWMAKLNLVLLPFLAKFGFWGMGALALLDSSTLPIPMDALLAFSVWNDKPRFWLYILMASIGSAIGGLLPYGLGRAGGELFLLKHVDRARLERIRERFEKQEFLAILIPSMMPPPTPWKLFVFASGVFEMRVAPFMLAVFAGRLLRWLALALLVLKLGPGAADLVAHHSMATVAVVGALAVIGFAWWWMRRKRAGKPMTE